MKDKKLFIKLMICIQGLIAWIVHFWFIFTAVLNDGYTHIYYNYYGEMIPEFFLCLGMIIFFTIVLIMYIKEKPNEVL